MKERFYLGSGYRGTSLMDAIFGGSLNSKVPAATWPFCELTVSQKRITFKLFDFTASLNPNESYSIKVTSLGYIQFNAPNMKPYGFAPVNLKRVVESLENSAYKVDKDKLKKALRARIVFLIITSIAVLGVLYGLLLHNL